MIMKHNFSPYRVVWVEFFPDFGITTKHDRKMFGDVSGCCINGNYRKHFSSREAAQNWLESFDASKLDKSYICRFFTDKQFALASAEDGFKIHYTRKQWDETYKLQGKR